MIKTFVSRYDPVPLCLLTQDFCPFLFSMSCGLPMHNSQCAILCECDTNKLLLFFQSPDRAPEDEQEGGSEC